MNQPYLFCFQDIKPEISSSVYIAPTAAVIGDVVIGDESSLWFGTVARGDVNQIRIGERTNIQDGTIIHVSSNGQGTYIGNDVTIGHRAVIHACTLEDRCFVGINACILDGAVVQSGAMVAAGALVVPGKVVTGGRLWAGVPARPSRPLKPEEIEDIDRISKGYVKLGQTYLRASTAGTTQA